MIPGMYKVSPFASLSLADGLAFVQTNNGGGARTVTR